MPSKLPQVFAELTGKGERPARSHPYRTRKGRTVAILLSGAVPTRAPARFSGAVVSGGELDLSRRLRAVGLVSAPTLVRLTRESPRDRSLAGSVVALAGIGILVAGLAWLRRRRS